MISWASIASGGQDAQIDTTAARVKAYGRKLFMAFHTEPEPQVGKYGTAAQFVAAWRHIHDRFAAKGVTNVVWVWQVTGSSNWYSLYKGGLYPGDAYVDWIGWDPYNWYTCHNNDWLSFATRPGRPTPGSWPTGSGTSPSCSPSTAPATCQGTPAPRRTGSRASPRRSSACRTSRRSSTSTTARPAPAVTGGSTPPRRRSPPSPRPATTPS